MKKINIFLATTEESLENDKKELGNFIRDLNDKFENYDVYFKLTNASSNMKNLSEEIQKSELFIVIFGSEISNETIKEFNIAYQTFLKNKTPKITTYIKNNSHKDESITNFLKKLDEELGHYYNSYDTIDTIKLNVVLSLKQLGIELRELQIKDDKLCLGKQEIMTLERLPMILNNTALRELKKQKDRIEEEYWIKREKKEESEEAFNQYNEINKKRQEIEHNILELENHIVELQSTFMEAYLDGNLSKRQIFAKKCLDQGNIEEAIQNLDIKELKEEKSNVIDLENRQNQNFDILLKEARQRIEILKKEVKSPKQRRELDNSYEELMRIENKIRKSF